ncbi:MAG: hypothetical protein LAO31_05360 [Acidobacteriia bacterium]|nr:hypothetical protein [Terriglobia bacterium]
MNILHRVSLIMTLTLLSSTLLSADTVELKNGEVIHGQFVSADPSFVKIKVGTEVRTFRTGKVTSIHFETAAEGAPAPPGEENVASRASVPAPPATTAPEPVAQAPAVQPAPPAAATRSSVTDHEVTVPAGTLFPVRMIDSIDTDKNQVGDHFSASLDDPVVIDGESVVPKNTIVHGRIIQAKDSGKISGSPELRLELTDFILNGRQIFLRTGEYEQTGEGRGTRSAEMIGGGAAVGAVIGAIAGKGKGVAIGAASGAAAGTAVQVLTKGNQIKIPSETRLSFRLDQPVKIFPREN